jgi:osmotically-inducible protein OsmY
VARLVKLTVAAAGAGLAIAAALLWGRRNSDATADRVAQALEAAVGESARAILVRAEQGVVTLRGEVDEMGDIARYEAVVRSVPGVRDVDNLLRLRLYGVVTRPASVSV